MTFDLEFAVGLLLTGLITFWSVYLGVRLAAKRDRYGRHVDRLKDETVDVLERWVNDIAINFSATSVPFDTLDEHDERPLKGYERRYYWDVPEAFQRPWDEKDMHRLRMAASHWPDLEDWNRIKDLGYHTYHNTGIVHQALVHMDDGVRYPKHQPRHLGDWENLQVASPGRRARFFLRQSFFDFTNKPVEDMVRVVEEAGGFGVTCCGHLVGVLESREAAATARNTMLKNLAHVPEAAKAVLEAGDSIQEMAEQLQKRALSLIYEADTVGVCPGCTRVAPLRHRLALAWRAFWATRRETGWRHGWRTARYRFRNGFFQPDSEKVAA